jgi:EAL domain-containing protein (putative c-di-GMP-specific phosphodiesterase class I)
LNQLRTLPVDVVKVDSFFIKDLHEPSCDTATLMRGIIGPAHNLQFRSGSEGVETKQ